MSDDFPVFEDERRCGGPVLLLYPAEYVVLGREDPLRRDDEDITRILQPEIIRCLEKAGSSGGQLCYLGSDTYMTTTRKPIKST